MALEGALCGSRLEGCDDGDANPVAAVVIRRVEVWGGDLVSGESVTHGAVGVAVD